MNTHPTYDVAIIGGGVIGLSIAHALTESKPDRRVCVIEAQSGSREASWAAAGMLAPYSEFADDTALGALAHDSATMYPRYVASLCRESGLPCTLVEAGSLLPELPGDDPSALENLAAVLRRRNYLYELLDRGAVLQREPALATDITRGLWLPERSVNNRQLWDALAEACRRRGVTLLLGHTVKTTIREEHRVTTVLAADTPIHAKTFVIAAGAWSKDIGSLFGIALPMTPVKGQMQRFDIPDGMLSHTIHREGTYVVPRPGYGIIVGTTMEECGFDHAVDHETLARMATAAAHIVPALAERTPCETWAGLRPKAPDGQPILGWAPHLQNVAIASGHFRNGILLTPMTGHVIAGLIDGTLDRDLTTFAPARFAQPR